MNVYTRDFRGNFVYLQNKNNQIITQQEWNNLKEGDVIVSLAEKHHFREIGDMFSIRELGQPGTIYYSHVNSTDYNEWILPTPQELIYFQKGIKNIKDIPKTINYEIY